jgi:hypothetical protein
MGAPFTIFIGDHSMHVAILREPTLYINGERKYGRIIRGWGGLLALEYEKAVKERLFLE